MKIAIPAVLFCILASACGTKHDASNPIDAAFAEDMRIASGYIEMNYVAEEYFEAWQAEWNNIIALVEEQFSLEADINIVRTFKRTFEEFARAAMNREWANWSDTESDPEKGRIPATGVYSAAVFEKAAQYKHQVLNIIDKHFQDGGYTFIYDGPGADLRHMRKLQERY